MSRNISDSVSIVLFVALVLVVGGSLAGEWMGIQQRLGNMWFWFGQF